MERERERPIISHGATNLREKDPPREREKEPLICKKRDTDLRNKEFGMREREIEMRDQKKKEGEVARFGRRKKEKETNTHTHIQRRIGS